MAPNPGSASHRKFYWDQILQEKLVWQEGTNIPDAAGNFSSLKERLKEFISIFKK